MYWILVGSIAFALANNVLLHLAAHKKLQYNGLLFNLFVSIVWVVLLLAYNGGVGEYDAKTFLYGGLYGVTLAGFLFFKQQALSSGPMMLSSLIGCSSFVFTTIFNAIYWKERLGVFEILGILLMVAAVIAVTYHPEKKEEGKGERLSLKWKICAGLFFLFAALTGIVFRFHQSVDKAHTNEMMIFASAVVVFLLGALLASQKLVEKKKSLPLSNEGGRVAFTKKQGWAAAAITVGCGVVSCVYNRLNIYLSGTMASTIFFPIFNGCVIITAAIVGWIFFKEKATKGQYVGCGLGVLAILCLSHFFGVL